MSEDRKAQIEAYLQSLFTENELPQSRIFDAMRYSLLAGGKRLRPLLTLEFCRVCGGEPEKALPLAAAIEMIHTYSLIHDDLPCMDDDDYRRGRLTNHKVYGEANAVLAGDGLLTAAFAEAAKAPLPPERTLRAISVLSEAAGAYGMVGGQVLDLDGEGKTLAEDDVHDIHRLKTGALIRAACMMGAIAAGASEEKIEAARVYAEQLGLAFQIRDDMLDVIGDAEKLGKATGMDGSKNTFVRLYGLSRCEELVMQHTNAAIEALSCLTDTEYLKNLALSLAKRDH